MHTKLAKRLIRLHNAEGERERGREGEERGSEREKREENAIYILYVYSAMPKCLINMEKQAVLSVVLL